MNVKLRDATVVALLIVFPCASLLGQEKAADKLPPDLTNVKYGPHERNVLDLWKAKSASPTPLVVFIHGGGFRGGDKDIIPLELLQQNLKAGFSVASINYRLSTQAPFPAAMHDGGRAIQFLRFKAKEWNLDPTRIAASGTSAGAGMSLWLGFHDDLASTQSQDPVERQSTRLTCMGVIAAQSSYDPRFIRKHIGGRAHEHYALTTMYGLKAGETDTPRAHRMYEEASPINHVSAGDPPAFLYFVEPKGPVPADARPGFGIHHPNFGTALKEKMDPLKIECVLRHRSDYSGGAPNPKEMYAEMAEFFGRQFRSVR